MRVEFRDTEPEQTTGSSRVNSSVMETVHVSEINAAVNLSLTITQLTVTHDTIIHHTTSKVRVVQLQRTTQDRGQTRVLLFGPFRPTNSVYLH